MTRASPGCSPERPLSWRGKTGLYCTSEVFLEVSAQILAPSLGIPTVIAAPALQAGMLESAATGRTAMG